MYCPVYHAGNIGDELGWIKGEFKKVAVKFDYHNNHWHSRCHELSLKHIQMTLKSLTDLEYSIQRRMQGIKLWQP
jgi:hypothetical protein